MSTLYCDRCDHVAEGDPRAIGTVHHACGGKLRELLDGQDYFAEAVGVDGVRRRIRVTREEAEALVADGARSVEGMS